MSDEWASDRAGSRRGPIIRGFPLGDFGTNCYLVRESDDPGATGWLVDVGDRPAALLDAAEASGAAVEAIVLTHAHWDHIAGVTEAKIRFPGAQILLHGLEHAWMRDPGLNLSEALGRPTTAPPADGTLEEGQELWLGPWVWRVLHTPGHTPGSVSLFCDARKADDHADGGDGRPGGVVIGGDTLFQGSVGRTDFPGGSPEVLTQAIREKLFPLGDSVVVLPGHGPATTIGAERATNPFVRD